MGYTRILDVVFYSSFAAALIALPVLVVNWARYVKVANAQPAAYRWAGFPVKSVLFFVVPILVVGLVASIATSYVRDEVLAFLDDLRSGYTVYVNGQMQPEPERIVGALKSVAPYAGHHSHPTTTIRVNVREAQESLTLDLRRDSGEPEEYWVFYTGTGITSTNEIGRITTPVFNRY